MGVLWSKSGTIERDSNDVKAGGALASFYAGGTTTPITVYQDAAETTPHTHPVAAASTGRWPTVFIPFRASYDLKVTTSSGTQLYYPTNIPNADPVEASEDSVEAHEIIQTGQWAFFSTTGTQSGYVRANGRTIGSAASGATERANADTSDLYAFLWNGHTDNSILAVSTGRGASAAADFAANKTIALPDARSATIVGVDDMGNSAASIGYGGSFTTGNATTGGSVGGANTHTLSTSETPAHTHGAGTLAADSGGAHTHTGTTDSGGAHTHTGTVTAHAGAGSASGTGNFTNAVDGSRALTIDSGGAHTHTFTTASGGAHTHTVSGTSGSTGGGGAHNNMMRFVLGTWYIHL